MSTKETCDLSYQYDYIIDYIADPAKPGEYPEDIKFEGRPNALPNLNKAVKDGWYPFQAFHHPGATGNTIMFLMEKVTWEEEKPVSEDPLAKGGCLDG